MHLGRDVRVRQTGRMRQGHASGWMKFRARQTIGLVSVSDALSGGEAALDVQLLDEEFASEFDFDVLDPTELIPEEQVAFCTQGVAPGIDFSDDPLLQGRNFPHLDTQLKRLGGPNFTLLPINAPRCLSAHFQQDGQMAMMNPKGCANCEPNSWGWRLQISSARPASFQRSSTNLPVP